ncbi:MAG: hypothetical protein M3Y34_04960, partial [Actinomycetota bacterium]|nr:hypothetical protein [Actinomycetota bacterium]
MPELLVAWVAFPAIQIIIWLGCGSLVVRTLSVPVSRALLVPLGFCVVVIAGGFTTAVPGLAWLTVPLVVALAVAGMLLAPPWREGRPSPWLMGALLVVFAVYAAPIVLSGSATFAGYIRLDDTATWLALTDRVMEAGRDLEGLAPSSYEATLAFNLADGYPIGAFIPLGVGKALGGIDAAWLVQPYMALLAILLTVALWELGGRLLGSSRARAAAACLPAQAALLYGYYLWGGIKEIVAAALIALVACLAFTAAGPAAGRRALIPLALAIAALMACLSPAAGVWLAPLLAGALALALATGPVGQAAGKAAILTLLVLAMAAPALLGGALLPPTSSPLDDPDARGNLIEPLAAVQALGIWPAGDFRVAPDAMGVTFALCLVAGIAALAGLVAAARRGQWAVATYVAGVPAAAGVIALAGSPWVDGKALAIASPAALFAAFLGCAWVWSERRLALGALAAALLAFGVVWSNALAFHEANLAPRDQLAELEEAGERLAGEGPTLMTEYQPYGVRHFLREANAEGASELRRRLVPLADGSSLEKGLWADTDDFRADAFEPYEALVLRRSPEQSRPPGAFELVWSGDFYDVWTRDPESPVAAERMPLGAGRSPAAKPPCDQVRALSRGVPGGVLRAARAREVRFFDRTHARIDLAAGRHLIWLEGSVRGDAKLLIDGEEVSSVRHALNNAGLYTLLGEVELPAGRHEIAVEFANPPLVPGSGGAAEHGPLAIEREGAPKIATVAAANAERLCGKAWDWIEATP